jgi:hypothetical protein
VDNIETNLEEMGWGCMDWIELAQDRQVAGACERRKPSGPTKCEELFE